MVAIVSGNGTGLNLTGNSSLGQRGTLGQASNGQAHERATVNVANGNLVLQDLDAILFGRGGDIGVVRTYNSQGTLTDDNGDAWQLSGYRRLINLAGTLNAAGSSIQRVDADGSALTYTYDAASNSYKTAAGSGKFDKLTYNATTLQWTWTEAATQNKEVYGANGAAWRLLSQSDLSGNTTTYNYTGNLLSSIVDANGESVLFTYSGNNLTQERILQADGTYVSNTYYRYDAQNRLQQVKVDLSPTDNSIGDGAVYVTSYSYLDTTNLVTSVSQTDGTQLNITYVTVNGQNRVASITDALGRATRFTYDTVNATTSVTDALGTSTAYRYDASNRLVSVTDAVSAGGAQVSYTYDAAGNLATVASGRQQTTYQYDAKGNLTGKLSTVAEVAAGAIVTVTNTYNDANRLLTSSVFRKPSNGATAAAEPETSRYVYDDKNNLRFLIGAEGNVTEYRYDSYGERTSTIDYLGVTYAAGSSAPALAPMTAWSAGQNQGLTTRADYRYNSRGQMTGITSFTSVASDGTGVANGTESITSYTYDASGNLLLKVDPKGRQTSYVYDGLNRVLSTTDALGHVTTNQYDDADHIVVHQQVDGRVDTAIFDAAGQMISSIQGGVAQTEYRYDGLGRLVMSVDPTGARQFYVYDAAGNLQAEVGGNGSVTQYVYNAQKQLVQTIRHSVALTSAQLAQLQGAYSTAATAMPPTPAGIQSWSADAVYVDGALVVYAGKVYRAKGGGGIYIPPVEMRDQGLLAQQSVQAALDGGHVLLPPDGGAEPDGPSGTWTEVALSSQPVSWSVNQDYAAGDRVSFGGRTYQAQVASRGSLPTTTSDWSAVTSAPSYTFQDMSSLWPVVTASDQVSYKLYNSLGQLAKTIDGAGHVVAYQYDGAGNLTAAIAYAKAVSTSGLGASSRPEDVVVTADAANDRTSYRYYDAGNRLVMTVDGEKYVTEYRYDSAGRNTDVIRYATALSSVPPTINVTAGTSTGSSTAPVPVTNSADQHSYLLYDGQGRLTGSVDAEGYLTEQIYDQAGNLTTTRRYQSKIVGSVMASSTVGSLRPADAIADTLYTTRTFDALNRVLTSYSSENNSQSTLQYDVAGNLVRVSTSNGTPGTPDNGGGARTNTLRYDSLGRLTGTLSGRGSLAMQSAFTDADKAAVWTQYGTSYAYDNAGRRISSTDPAGNKTRFYYDQAGHLTHTVNALGEVRENRYDAMGQLTGTVRYGVRIAAATLAGLSGGLNSALSAALAGIVNAAVDSKTAVTYNLDGTVASQADELGLATTYLYDAFGDRVSTTRGSRTDTVTVDRRGLVTLSTEVVNQPRRTYVQYDGFGRAVRVTDPRGKVTQTSYDRLGRVVTVADPTNAQRSTSYDAFHNVLTQTDALGNITRYQFDRTARTSTVTTPEGITYTTQLDFEGERQSVTDGNGNVTAYFYDQDGNLVRSTLNGVTQASGQFDAAGRATSTTDANGVVTSFTYDAANRVLTRTVDAGTGGLNLTTTYTYDAKGERLGVTDPAGIVTQYTYDLLGNVLTQAIDPTGLNAITRYAYDSYHRLFTITSPGGNQTQYNYNDYGQLSSVTSAAAKLNLWLSVGYDDNGNLQSRTDQNGNTTGYVYDDANRLIYTVDATGQVTENTYDAAGRVIRATTYAKPISLAGLQMWVLTRDAVAARVVASSGQDQVENRVYDKNNRLRYSVDATGGVTSYTYDGNGNVIDRTTYANRINMATWSLGTTPPVVADSVHDQRERTVYDQANRALYTVDGNGAVTAFKYDASGNVTEQIAYAKAIPVTTAATASAIGAAVAAIANAGTDIHVRNVYDKANRLTFSADGVGAVTQNVYDADGRIIKQVRYATAIASTAAPSSVAASADDSVTMMGYDNAGHLAYQVDALGGVTRRYYDANGNLTQTTLYARAITAPVAGSTPPTVASLDASVQADAANDRTAYRIYDAANRLIYFIDANRTITKYTYDACSRAVATLVYASNSVTPALLASWGHAPTDSQLQSYLTPNSGLDKLIQRAYDAAGRLVYSTDALGYVTENKYDGRGLRTATVKHGAALTAGTANTVAAIASALAAAPTTDDRTTSYAYDASGALTQATDALGNTEKYQYDGAGRRTSYTNQNGATWTYAYDAAGNMVSETAPAVALTGVSTDAGGNMVAGATTTAAVVTTMTYDALGNLTARTEAAGRPEARTTSYVYDALGRQVKTIFPSVAVYNESGDSLATNGANTLASRTETTQQAYSQVYYDTLGNAVGNRDVAGNMSYKAYDKAGQVAYEVDAAGYVTGYQRDAFGEATSTTRYAVAGGLSLAPNTMPTTAQVASAVAPHDHTLDRTVTVTYDRQGRVLTVTQPQTWVSNGVQGTTASQVTKNTYDTFGQLVQTSVLNDAAANTWNTTTYYYDRDGRRAGSINALGFVTRNSYDAVGNQVATTEYATALTSWSASTLSTPASSADDRSVTCAYDKLNRKISETRLNVQFSDGTSDVANRTRSRGNVVTSYAYDAAGNQTVITDALGNKTYTYYDALGRVVAVALPTLTSTLNGVALTPLTEFRRDALGNIAVQIDYANGAASVSATGYTAAASYGDRQTLSAYDSAGHVLESRDANGVDTYSSYDVQGHLRKQWQLVTGNDGVGHTLFTAYRYDALGRRTATIIPASTTQLSGTTLTTVSQASAGVVTMDAEYNAFGEVTRQGTNGGRQVYFDYDNAGHMWRTNSGGGTDTVFIYDLQGRQTTLLSSAGAVNGVNLGGNPVLGITSAQQAEQLSNMRRTTFQRDLLGRVTTITQPDRSGVRPVINQTFDRWGNTLSRSSLFGASSVTTFTYNANNQVIVQSDPDGSGVQSASSPVTQIYYDRLGRQIAQRAPNDQVSSQSWDAAGNVVNETHADGGVAIHYYDALNRQVGLKDPNGNLKTVVLDKMGRMLQTTTTVVGVYSVSSTNVLSGASQALTTSMKYDEAGRLLYKIDEGGRKTSYDYDLRGNVVAAHAPTGQNEQYAYDTQGNKIADRDANGNIATWSYDYFGLVQSRRDIGGGTYSYTYDSARQLFTETSSRGANIGYAYDGAGNVIQVRDAALDKTTLTTYNAAGQHLREQVIQKGKLYQDTQLAYSAQGQLARVDAVGNGVTVLMSYDQMGNLVHRQTTTTAHGASVTSQNITYVDGTVHTVTQEIAAQVAQTESLWAAFDAMGRELETDGAVNSNANDASNLTPTQGHVQTYDKNGNRISDTSWGKELVAVVNGTSVTYTMREGLITRYYQYDAENRLVSISLAAYNTAGQALTTNAVVIEQRYYDALGRLVQDGMGDQLPTGYRNALAAFPDQADNFVTTQYRYGTNDLLLSRRTTQLDGTQRGIVNYSSYDAAGNQLAYTATNNKGQNQTVQITQVALDGYRQQTVVNSVTTGTGTAKVTRTERGYDANGLLITTTITDPSNVVSVKSVVNDADGNVLYSLEKGQTTTHLDAVGQVLDVWQGTSTAVTPLMMSPVDPLTPDSSISPRHAGVASGGMTTPDMAMVADPGDTGGGGSAMPAGRVTGYDESGNALIALAAGDTLQSLAQQAYGDASLWYLIANANGISGNTSLAVGSRLIIPTVDSGGTAYHSTDASVVGTHESDFWGMAPPPAPAPSSGGGGGRCGGLGKVLMVVVAVAVTYVTAGAATMFLGGAQAGLGAVAAGSAIGAAAGSIASQAVGLATGDVDKFSWNAVGKAALSAGVGAGVGGLAEMGANAILPGSGILATAGRAVIANVATQAVGVATGMQDHMDWTGAAISGVTSAVGQVVGKGVADAVNDADLSDSTKKIITQGLTGTATGVTGAVLRGGSVDVVSIGLDAFGNAVGNSIGAAMTAAPEPSARPEVGSAEYNEKVRNGEIEPEPRPPAQVRDVAPISIDESEISKPLSIDNDIFGSALEGLISANSNQNGATFSQDVDQRTLSNSLLVQKTPDFANASSLDASMGGIGFEESTAELKKWMMDAQARVNPGFTQAIGNSMGLAATIAASLGLADKPAEVTQSYAFPTSDKYGSLNDKLDPVTHNLREGVTQADLFAAARKLNLPIAVQESGITNSVLQSYSNSVSMAMELEARGTPSLIINAYNATQGPKLDLVESGLEKAGMDTAPVIGTRLSILAAMQSNALLSNQLEQTVTTQVWGHSEGSIITNQAIGGIDERLRTNIDLRNFGVAIGSAPSGLNSYVGAANANDTVYQLAGQKLTSTGGVQYSPGFIEGNQRNPGSYQFTETHFVVGDNGRIVNGDANHSWQYYMTDSNTRQSFGLAPLTPKLQNYYSHSMWVRGE